MNLKQWCARECFGRIVRSVQMAHWEWRRMLNRVEKYQAWREAFAATVTSLAEINMGIQGANAYLRWDYALILRGMDLALGQLQRARDQVAQMAREDAA